ncbi:MAG: hypothetical protein ACI92C_002896, partial [Neolewinella sp.]
KTTLLDILRLPFRYAATTRSSGREKADHPAKYSVVLVQAQVNKLKNKVNA